MDDEQHIEPGTRATVSGQYAAFREDGMPLAYEATVTRGEPLPPLRVPGYWVLADASRRLGKEE